jgi:hypothetical protein
MREQDDQMTKVNEAIDVLRTMGKTIGDEIDDQNVLLE